MTDKTELVQLILAALAQELEGYARSAKAAQAEATDEQSKAENKYDTRGLEASYLARGQSRQAAETGEAWQQYATWEPRAFSGSEAIDLGALVELEQGGDRTLYFLGPCAGGTEIVWKERPVVVITPASPLGKELLGRKVGGRVLLPGRGRREVYDIRGVE